MNVCQKNLDKYKTVRDTLQNLNTKILLKKSHIDKLTLVKSNLESSLILFNYNYLLLLYPFKCTDTNTKATKNMFNL